MALPRGARDVIQVVIDHNVGAGVITDGRLLHAGSSSLVEIGHTQVDPYGKRCYCGNHGCLETIASVESVLELAQVRLSQSMSSTLHGQPLSVEALCTAARQGDLLAKDIITGVGNNVGRILAIMVNLFNPQKNTDWLPAQPGGGYPLSGDFRLHQPAGASRIQ